MSDSLFNFGRYEGRPYEEVAIEDPAYFVWAHESFLIEADPELYQMALTIMPTDSDAEDLDEEYEFDRPPNEAFDFEGNYYNPDEDDYDSSNGNGC